MPCHDKLAQYPARCLLSVPGGAVVELSDNSSVTIDVSSKHMVADRVRVPTRFIIFFLFIYLTQRTQNLKLR